MSPVRRRVGAMLRPYRRLIALAGVGIVGATAVTIAAPLLLRYAIDEGVRKDDLGPVNTAALIYLGLALLRPLVERLIVLSSARAGERFLGDLRVAAYDHLQRLSMPFFESERAGVLVSRLTADVQSLTTFVRQVLVEVVGNMLLLVVTLAIALLPLADPRRGRLRLAADPAHLVGVVSQAVAADVPRAA